MRATRALLTVCLLSLALPAMAQIQKFPYEASVTGEDVYLRSGPGKKYYPTGRLRAGDRVIVHRHDPGGWYMVAPPQGSFSMVRADAVKPLGNRRGLIVANNVPALVGSVIGEARDVEQVRLSTNDEVTLLDDTPITVGVNQNVYRIVPPRGEYRWMLGQYAAPVDEALRRQHDRDPFATPSNARPLAGDGLTNSPPPTDAAGNRLVPAPIEVDDAASGFSTAKPASPTPVGKPLPSNSLAATPGGTPPAPSSAAVTTPELEQYRAERNRLFELDEALRTTLESDISAWNLGAIEQGYRQLAETGKHPTLARQIEPRLATLAYHQGLKNEYDDFMRVTIETDRRDAELAARLGGAAPTTTGFRAAPAMTNVSAAPADPATPDPTFATAPMAAEIAADVTNPADPFQPPVVAQPPQAADFFPVTGPSLGEPPTPNPLPDLTPVPSVATTEIANPPVAVNPAAPVQPAPYPTMPATPNFSGAGIVQKTQPVAPGMPSYVLMSPQGRVLAFLQPGAGVNLDGMIGRPVGVVGPRQRHPQLRSDLISVEDASPVRLAPR